MGLASVAEGVTSASATRRLTELGIDALQGFYFSGPLPFDGFAAWLREWRSGARSRPA
jgi:EAL domain-containing protein (putative c-di-GMP-specific phosphodiesterase class I)